MRKFDHFELFKIAVNVIYISTFLYAFAFTIFSFITQTL